MGTTPWSEIHYKSDDHEESVEIAELRGQLVLALGTGEIDTSEPPLAELPLRLAARARNE